MTTITDRLSPHDAVEAAIARVLDAEHAARAAVATAEETAAAMVEDARAAVRALASRTESRIRAVRAAFEARTAAEVAALDAEAAAADLHHELTRAEAASLDAASRLSPRTSPAPPLTRQWAASNTRKHDCGHATERARTRSAWRRLEHGARIRGPARRCAHLGVPALDHRHRRRGDAAPDRGAAARALARSRRAKSRRGCPTNGRARSNGAPSPPIFRSSQHLARGGALPAVDARRCRLWRSGRARIGAQKRSAGPRSARAARRGVGRTRSRRARVGQPSGGAGCRRARTPGDTLLRRLGRVLAAQRSALPRPRARATASRCAARCRRGSRSLFRRAMLDPAAAFIFLALIGTRSRAAARRTRSGAPLSPAFRWQAPHDPAAARPLVRNSRRPRRRHAGARSAGDDGRRRTRGAGEARCCLRRSPTCVPRCRSLPSCRCATTPIGRTQGTARRAFPEPPAATLARSLAQLRAWAEEAEPVIQQIAARRERARRRSCCGAACWRDRRHRPRFRAPCRAPARCVHVRLAVFPPDSEPELPAGASWCATSISTERWLRAGRLTVGAAEDVAGARAAGGLAQGPASTMRRHGSRADAAETERYIAPRLAALEHEDAGCAPRSTALHAKHDLCTALGDASRLHWVIENVRALESGELLLLDHRLDERPRRRAARRCAGALGRARARCIFPPPPPRRGAPLLLANPLWARPFEIFSRALGMPSRNEADPSMLLAIAVPLMFGYMFGDVGQGLVIAAAGLALREAVPLARLFISGGFGRHAVRRAVRQRLLLHAIPPLWLAPLDYPLDDPARPACRRSGAADGRPRAQCARSLVARRARGLDQRPMPATSPSYLGILGGFVDPAGFAVAGAGALVFCVGRARARRSRHGCLDRDGRAGRAPAADPDQHALVRARRRIRARARGPLVGDRRADGCRRQRR